MKQILWLGSQILVILLLNCSSSKQPQAPKSSTAPIAPENRETFKNELSTSRSLDPFDQAVAAATGAMAIAQSAPSQDDWLLGVEPRYVRFFIISPETLTE